MEKVQKYSQRPRLDMPELLNRVDNDRELVHDLLAIFKEEFPPQLQALHDAVASEDMTQTRVVSHTLKGMLSNLSITGAAKAAGKLEQLAHDGTKASLQEAFTAFELQVQGLLPEMETHMAEVRR
jgi:HPt (histidine-containing phosphotransfer) domain-containing protein